MVKFLTKKQDEERKKNTYFVSNAIFIKTTNENKIATPEFNSFAINSGFVFLFPEDSYYNLSMTIVSESFSDDLRNENSSRYKSIRDRVIGEVGVTWLLLFVDSFLSLNLLFLFFFNLRFNLYIYIHIYIFIYIYTYMSGSTFCWSTKQTCIKIHMCSYWVVYLLLNRSLIVEHCSGSNGELPGFVYIYIYIYIYIYMF